MTRRITRRALVVGGAAAGAAVVLRAVVDDGSPSPGPAAPAGVDGDEGEVADVRGRMERLADTRDRAGFRATIPLLDADVRADFADGRTVVLAGWLLAETEARAAAVVSLLPAR